MNKDDFTIMDYLQCISILRKIGFSQEEITQGINAMPDDWTGDLRSLIIQIGANCLKWIHDHEKN